MASADWRTTESKAMTNARNEWEIGLGRREVGHALRGFDNETDYLWCIVCERTFRRGAFRQVGDKRLCPYDRCDGGLLFEPWEWSQVRKENPGYPRVPYEDVVYPFFGPVGFSGRP